MRPPALALTRSKVSLPTLIFLACALAGAAVGQTAFVRVNQVGYVSGAAKRAYLMASAAETGATFVIKNSSGLTVFGPSAISASLGSWSTGYHNVYALDFDSFTSAGTYSISVSGPIACGHQSGSDHRGRAGLRGQSAGKREWADQYGGVRAVKRLIRGSGRAGAAFAKRTRSLDETN